MSDEHGTNGIVIGIVSTLDDQESIGRVRVKYPHLGNVESDWARLVGPMAGPDAACSSGPRSMTRCSWRSSTAIRVARTSSARCGARRTCRPRTTGTRRPNNWRFIRSRSGHIIQLDDTAGKEKIELIDKDGQRRIVIDSASSPPKISVLSNGGDIEIKAPSGKVLIEADTVTVRANQTLTLTSNGTTELKGSTVNIN